MFPLPLHCDALPSAPMAERKVHIWFAVFLGWMIPGLGHFYARRAVHGAFYFVMIAGIYAAGMVVSRGTAVNADAHGTYFLLQMLASPITLSLEFMRDRGDMGLGDSLPVLAHQSGVVYAATAGVLNMIVLCELHRRHEAPNAPGPSDTMRAELKFRPKSDEVEPQA